MYITVEVPKELQDNTEEIIGKDIDLWISTHMPKLGSRHIVVSPMGGDYAVTIFRYKVRHNLRSFPKFPILAQFTVKVISPP